jgi:hypothetical protein
MNNKKEKEITNEWYEKAKKMTIKELPDFLKEIDEYPHTYNTLIDGIVASAIAGAYAIENGKHGGISGFQASFIDLLFVQKWGVRKSPFKIQSYEDWLYPHMDYKSTSVSPEIFKELQKLAKERLNESEKYGYKDTVDKSVMDRWEMIIDGRLPPHFKIIDD